MENNEKDILGKVNGDSGMTVPEGYFDDFAKRMTASLPRQPWEDKPVVLPRSFWQRVRPYVYMAAMFAGIWCMMKMVDLMRGDVSAVPGVNNAIMAEAINNDVFISDYFVDDVSDYELLDELYESGFHPASLTFE